MSRIGGYVIRLSKPRIEAFEYRLDKSRFAEPVDEFQHSRSVPLVCIFASSHGHITHIGLGHRGTSAGTEMRRLNISDIHELNEPLKLEGFLETTPKMHQKRLAERFRAGGKVSDKAFDVLIEAMVGARPELLPRLAKFRTARRARIAALSARAKTILAEEKEAIGTALAMSGIDRNAIGAWDFQGDDTPTSFLAGLPGARLREDQMIINDLQKFPGLNQVAAHIACSVTFASDSRTLTVVLANRLPLEQLTGVDLIYYNQTFRCFLMVQYKAMEADDEEAEAVFRFPEKQMSEEISRMKRLLKAFAGVQSTKHADSYRVNENPFFLKFCPRLVFDPDNQSLCKGMYLPLDYWVELSAHPAMVGPKGGMRLSYRNVRRYLDNTSFCTIAGSGWIGTTFEQSSLLEKLVRETLESGRAVVLASFNNSDVRHRVGD